MIYSQEKDEILVSMTLLGDQQAYEALVNRWQKAVLSVARGITHSEHLAEDATQDAFVSAWLKLNTLRDGSKYGTWVCNIARNRSRDLLSRFREWVDIDYIAAMEDKEDVFFAELADCGDEAVELQDNLNSLSEKVRKVIDLHYFGGYSIAEIAEMLSIPQNTVKTRLSQGRQKLRKEYGLMNEKDTDTLVEKVMKKVEELKLWRLKDNKEGFDAIWRDTMSAVEALPDCTEKDYALADTLLLGYWWVKGEANDEVLARMKEAALRSRNEDVLQMVVANEQNNVKGEAYTELVQTVQIPEYEKLGMKKVQGYLWFWLGRHLFDSGMNEEGLAAFNKTLDLLEKSDMYYACAIAALRVEKLGNTSNDNILAISEKYIIEQNKLRFDSQPGYSRGCDAGYLPYIGIDAAKCDRTFFDRSLHVGTTVTSSNGTSTLTFKANDVSVSTPCGTFDECELWETNQRYVGITKTYYKEGVGIVKQEKAKRGTYVLCDFNICGGEGLMPLAEGNYWDYNVEEHKQKYIKCINHREVISADEKEAVISEYAIVSRVGYDPTDWKDIATEIRRSYFCIDDEKTGEGHIVDVSHLANELEATAKSNYETAHTHLATAALRRLIACEETINPETKLKGLWNFFSRNAILKSNSSIIQDLDGPVYAFEAKDMANSDWTPGTWEARHVLLWNDINGIIYDMTGSIWSDEWVPGYEVTKKVKMFDMYEIESKITVSDGGRVVTAAGEFDNCICVHVESKGAPGGLSYRQNAKDYYYAPGVGIVRTVHHYGAGNSLQGVYDLISYAGTGEGYFPVAAGMERVYEAVNMRDGYEAGCHYIYEEDENGVLYAISDQKGIRNLE